MHGWMSLWRDTFLERWMDVAMGGYKHCLMARVNHSAVVALSYFPAAGQTMELQHSGDGRKEGKFELTVTATLDIHLTSDNGKLNG